MNLKEENEMKTKEEKDQKLYERVLNAKTPEEQIKMAIKNFKKDDQICSAILYLAPEVVGEGKSSTLVSTLDDEYGTLQGQLQLDMMTNVGMRNFLMELVDMYRENRCTDDIIEDAFYCCGKYDEWCDLSEKAEPQTFEYMRLIANDKFTNDQKKFERLRNYINARFKDGKEEEGK